jgi:glycine/D-amino acid oxidase-like deaminating enzyme
MKSHAQIVVVGGGIAGASIAYHLAQLGRRDVVVLEQGPLVSGTTSHAPGLVGQLRSSTALARMLMYSVSLYRTLSLDGVPGYLGEGSVRLASSPARWAQIRAQADFAHTIGLEAHLLDAAETARRFPLLGAGGVEGSLYLPTDGSATATVLAGAMIRAARDAGVEFHANAKVQAIEVTNGRVRAVRTALGRVELETLVIAAGIWSPLVGRLAGVSIPLTPMQHQYAVTDPLPELRGSVLPNLRDPDHLFYVRQRDDSLVIGGYERTPHTFRCEDIPERPDPTVQAFDAGQFGSIIRGMERRLPGLKRVGFTKRVNGLESFTPDGEFLLGPAPEAEGVWAACGFCAHGVSGAGGVGQVIAEWIAHGDPGMDLSHMALSRFGGRHLDRVTIEQRASAVYATYYDIVSGLPASSR